LKGSENYGRKNCWNSRKKIKEGVEKAGLGEHEGTGRETYLPQVDSADFFDSSMEKLKEAIKKPKGKAVVDNPKPVVTKKPA
jgi:hypothetical protein